MLGIAADVRNALNGGRAGANDRDALVGQFDQAAGRIAAGIVEIPPRGMKAVALESCDPGNAWQFRLVQNARGHDHKTGPDIVTLVGADPPALNPVVPTQRADDGAEERMLVQAKMFADPPAVSVNLRTERI